MFETIDNSLIKDIATEYLSYIKIEHQGDELLVEAETYFDENNFLGAMKCLESADVSYSSYHVLRDIYNDSREILLDGIGTPVTVAEYEIAIRNLENYILEVDEPKFFELLETLETELSEYEGIYTILSEATELYEKASYKKAFKKLEEEQKNIPIIINSSMHLHHYNMHIF